VCLLPLPLFLDLDGAKSFLSISLSISGILAYLAASSEVTSLILGSK
jgi:hypothetical protein